MCECLRGIFCLNWTPSFNTDTDRALEDSYSNLAVKNKRQSPPSPPSVPQTSQRLCITTEDAESAERVVQKEKLHAELKQVLSKKRSQLKHSHTDLASMDPSKDKIESLEEKRRLSEIVEMVVETEAEVGASGYSVVGGGTKGIFIKDVLKDSPAAKHLSLQKGDQLLSARVYFDNVKYEDALKILQCAEPYKVSFFLKRTVAQTEDSGHQNTPVIEQKGPKTKLQKMSVRSVKQFKAKKKRGGRFGLKRLKERKRTRAEEEIDIGKSAALNQPLRTITNKMLQHNNNNNYPCLDVAHRELLHGCRRNGTTFSSALGFGAIPLIKGLRAWAVSGGYSRSKRKTAAASQASDTAHESRIGSIHRKTHSFHTPGVRQGGLGALVTVATLKDSDGGRQTQTRCLFLNAEGCNYLCTVGTRVDGRKSEKGSQDGLGISDGRPVRKWRKSNKRPKSMENISLVENKEGDSSTKPELLDKCSITQCLQAKSALTAINNDEEHANGSQFSVKEDTTLASCPKLNYSFVDQDIPISTSDCTENTTELSQNESEFIAEVTLNHVLKSKESAMPYSEKHSPGFEVVMHKKNGILSTISHNHTTHTILAERNLNKSSEFDMKKSKQHGLESEIVSEDTNKTNGTNSHCHFEEAIITPAFSNLSDDTFLTVSQVEREIKKRKDESSLNNEMEKIVHFGEMKKVDHLKEPAEEHLGSPVCCFHQKQEVIMEVNMTFKEGGELDATNETFEELANSLSQGSGFFIVANAITSSSNPAPTTNATALRAISSQQQEETKGMRLAVKPALEQFKKQERGQEEENVADEELGVVDEADEDEFGIFMKAGDEQIWNAGFNELKKVPCEKNVGIDITNSSVSNEPLSLMSDWTRDLSVKQSEDIWTAFKQEVASRGAEKECWFSTAVENMHLTHSSLNTVPNVFLDAFPCLKSSCGDSDSIPTLTELLRGPATDSLPDTNGKQSLLDGLQDLDRMIGVKYKVSESLSRKILLQSLNLRTPKPERAGGRKHNMARFSPNLPTSNQQKAAYAKRRLSYDINRNIMS